MNIFSSISDLSALREPIVLVGGTFDGVHIGHQALIRRAQEEANQCGGRVVVMTFDQHPAAFLRPEKAPKLLTNPEQKIKLLEELGVDKVLLLPFNAALAATTAEQFIHQLAAAAPELKTICVGANWSFGQGGKGNLALLRQLGEELHFSVITIDPVQAEGEIISSTRIRNALAAGDLKAAATCLGRPYALAGTVIRGAGLGKDLGFPTANIAVDHAQLPPSGVYIARVLFNGASYPAGVNIGVRPSVFVPSIDGTKNLVTVEVHLLDFKEELYGREIKVELISFLREERTFMHEEDLKAQIQQDLEMGRRIYVRETADPAV